MISDCFSSLSKRRGVVNIGMIIAGEYARILPNHSANITTAHIQARVIFYSFEIRLTRIAPPLTKRRGIGVLATYTAASHLLGYTPPREDIVFSGWRTRAAWLNGKP